MDWVVICTKPKWELKVTAQLTNYCIKCYCPTVMKERQWSERIKIIKTPLFNNYVFVQLKAKDRNLVFLSPGVIRYLYWNNDYAVVKNDEIETIKKWLKLVKVKNNEGDKLKIGASVKINKHPFLTNQKGIIKDITKKEYLLVLETLGYVLHISKEEEISDIEK